MTCALRMPVPPDADLLCTQLEQLRCAADATDLAGMITATFESELRCDWPAAC